MKKSAIDLRIQSLEMDSLAYEVITEVVEANKCPERRKALRHVARALAVLRHIQESDNARATYEPLARAALAELVTMLDKPEEKLGPPPLRRKLRVVTGKSIKVR